MNTEPLDPIIHPLFDRYTPGQFAFVRSEDSISRLRREFIEMLSRIDPTHYLTFNFYNGYSMERAQKMMDRWYADIHYRLFKAHPNKLPESRIMPMVGHPEYTESGDIHYHAVARISADRQDWFLKVASKRWKAIVKTGDLHIKGFDGTETGLERAAVYSTKSSSHVEWYIPAGYRGSAFDPSAHVGRTKH